MTIKPEKPKRPEGMSRVAWKESLGIRPTGLDFHHDRVDAGEAKKYSDLSDEEKQFYLIESTAKRPKTLKDNFQEMLPDSIRITNASLTGGSVQCRIQWFGTIEQEHEARKDNPSVEFITDEDGMRWRIEYKAVSKQQWETAKYVLDKFTSLEKHIPDVKIKKLEAEKKVKEAKTEGYGEFEQEKIKEQAQSTGLRALTVGDYYEPDDE